MKERNNIRERLNSNSLTQVWLMKQLLIRGIVTDKTEMSSILAGTRNGAKAESIVKLSEEILDRYEKKFCPVK